MGIPEKSGQLPVYVQRSVCFLKSEFHYLKEVRQKKIQFLR